MKQFYIAGAIIVPVLLAVLADRWWSFDSRPESLLVDPDHVAPAEEKPREPKLHKPRQASVPEMLMTSERLPRGSSFYQVLKSRGLGSKELLLLIELAKPLINLQELAAGTEFKFHSRAGLLEKIDVGLSSTASIIFERGREQGAAWKVSKLERPVETRALFFHGTINSSLWNSAQLAGLAPQLIEAFTEIFSWQLDFARELRPGARWALLVEERRVQDRSVSFGPILAAQLTNSDHEWVGIRFNDGHHTDYYDLEGKNLRGKFLKSPVKYSRISSTFQRKRFHPILKVNRPHLGVDYAARRGTKIYAVGDGVVVMSGRWRASGNTVKIRHDRRHLTAYKHMSRIAKGIKMNGRVRQGQVIGYVGQTGLATGPHLHFEFRQDGRFVDPLGIRFPREKSVPKSELQTYLSLVNEMYTLLTLNLERVSGSSAQDIPRS